MEKSLIKKILIAIVIVLAAGSVLLFVLSGNMEPVKAEKAETQEDKESAVSGSSVDAALESGGAPEGSIAAEMKTAADKEEAEEAGLLTAEISTVSREDVAAKGYSRVEITTSRSSAELNGKKYSAGAAVDGDETTSWQEGESGNGEGATLTYGFNRTAPVRYIFFKLGSWKDDDSYRQNNRPSKITIAIGGESVQVTFPDQQQEYCVALSRDVSAEEIAFTVDAVYEGSKYQDTCISEIEVDAAAS